MYTTSPSSLLNTTAGSLITAGSLNLSPSSLNVSSGSL